MSTRGRRLLALGSSAGMLVGILSRATSNGEAWLVALLALSAAVVGLAQQTLP